MTKRYAIVSAIAVMALGFAMVGTALAATTTVTLTAENTFTPANPSVAVGDTVNFVWDGGFHDVVFADGVSSGTPVGDVGTTYARTFDTAGSFAYVCTVHEALGMTGTVTVAAASGGGSSGGGGSGGGSGSGSSSLPFTGPEDGILPAIGVLLVVFGAFALVRASRVR